MGQTIPDLIGRHLVYYTLWENGRLLGRTDFGFIYRPHNFRAGWLHPTPAGEELMPVACGVTAAMIASAKRAQHSDAGVRSTDAHAASVESGLAEFQAACARAEALELEVRREDGSVVPTDGIGIRDARLMVELARLCEAEMDAEPQEYDPELEEAIRHDSELIAEWFAEREGDTDTEGSDVSPEDDPLQRYQISTHLLNESDIP